VEIKRYQKKILTLLVILSIIAGFFILAFIVRPLYNPKFVENILKEFGIWGPPIFIFLQILQVLLAPIPGHVLGFISGVIYGPLLGTLYSMAGLTIGAYLAFRLSKFFGRPFVERNVREENLRKYDTLLEKRGAPLLFILFLLPGFPDDALAYLAGLTKMDDYSFLLAVFFGRLPGIVLITLAGREWAKERIVLFLLLAVISLLLVALLLKYRNRVEGFFSSLLFKK